MSEEYLNTWTESLPVCLYVYGETHIIIGHIAIQSCIRGVNGDVVGQQQIMERARSKELNTH